MVGFNSEMNPPLPCVGMLQGMDSRGVLVNIDRVGYSYSGVWRRWAFCCLRGVLAADGVAVDFGLLAAGG